jgi:RNA polymerase sigma-70 factor, ECF subfamily
MTDWASIVQEHGSIVWRTVRKLVPDEHAAADCFQETFIAAMKFARRTPVQNWPALLTHLATARALDHLRMQRRDPAVSSSLLQGVEIPSAAQLPLEQAQQNELFDHLRAALATMPANMAEACCLRFIEQFSYEDIAEQLGITVNHVGVLLTRAKTELQRQLTPFSSGFVTRTTEEVRQ